MNKSAMLATASALGLLAPLPASAVTVTLDWSVSSYGSGTITAGPTTATHSGYTGYVATAVTGTWLSSPVSLLSPNPFENNDNLVYNPVTASPSGNGFLDSKGVAFSGSYFDVDLSFNGTGYQAVFDDPLTIGAFYYCVSKGEDCNTQTVAATVTLAATTSATPLPTSLPLFAGGAAIVGLVARRRKKKSADIVGA